jgi:hypothetical protein
MSGCVDLTETDIQEMFSRISKIKSAGVIERYGFNEFLTFAKEVRDRVSDDIWLEVGWDILDGLGLDEFYGCDYDIFEALDNIPPESDLIDIQSFLRHKLVETLLEQFDVGGTTILLDIEKMLETPATVLIPRIIELRKKEIENLSVPIVGKKLVVYDVFMDELGMTTDPIDAVHLEDLWMTAYGFQVLLTLELGTRTDLEGLRKIEIVMNRLGLNLNIVNIPKQITNPKSIMSEAMRHLLMQRIHRKPNRSRTKKYQA